jgi:putative salt-induced outer membrane protein YdiY
VPPGRVTLSYVACVIYAAVTQTVVHQMDMDIDVPSGNQAAYFGEVSVAFQSQKKNLFVEALTPALAKAMIPAKRGPRSEHTVVYNRPKAESELRSRYGSAIQQLKLVQASQPDTAPVSE